MKHTALLVSLIAILGCFNSLNAQIVIRESIAEIDFISKGTPFVIIGGVDLINNGRGKIHAQRAWIECSAQNYSNVSPPSVLSIPSSAFAIKGIAYTHTPWIIEDSPLPSGTLVHCDLYIGITNVDSQINGSNDLFVKNARLKILQF